MLLEEVAGVEAHRQGGQGPEGEDQVKIRTGFVSNSSSASFIVLLAKTMSAASLAEIIMAEQRKERLDFDLSAAEEAAALLLRAAEEGIHQDGLRFGGGTVSNEDDEAGNLLYNLGDFAAEGVQYKMVDQ